jgi:protease-4
MTAAGRLALVFILLVLIAAVTVVVVAFAVAGLGSPGWRSGAPASGPVLTLELEGTIPETSPNDALTRFFEPDRKNLRGLLLALHHAASDPEIEGLFARIEQPRLGWARAEELRAAISAFGAQGKWSAVQLDSAESNVSYYLASAFDEIYLAPPGGVGLIGLRVEQPFARPLLEHLEIRPQFVRRKEYKSAANVYTEDGFTAEHREATRALIDSFHEHVVTAVAEGRGMEPAQVQRLIDGGPYMASEAQDLGLVDHLAYRDEAIEAIKDRFDGKNAFVPWSRYAADRGDEGAVGSIALVYALGGIARGESGNELLSGRRLGAETIKRALERARKDRNVAAVVLRIDSPGGSYVASDLIRRQVALTVEEKPVVASFGNYAASGGYFIGMQSSRVVASDLTTTGSIGVISGKLVTGEFWSDKLRVPVSGLQTGENAEIYSPQEPFDEAGWARVNTMMDGVYEDFVRKAAEGRNMPFERAEALARGRVWSGRDARERGLVDERGGLLRAIELARELAELPEDRPVRLRILPRPPGFWESLRQRQPGLVELSGEAGRALLEGLAELDRLDPRGRLEDPALPRVK